MAADLRNKRLRFVLLVVFCIAMLASTFVAVTVAKSPPTLNLRIKVGQQAPDFTIPGGNGDPVRLSSLRGHGVLLYFYRGYW